MFSNLKIKWKISLFISFIVIAIMALVAFSMNTFTKNIISLTNKLE